MRGPVLPSNQLETEIFVNKQHSEHFGSGCESAAGILEPIRGINKSL